MKCNPDAPVLERVHSLGGKFEIASYAELRMLQRIGADPASVLYSNPVKSRRDIKLAYKAGVRCFSFQSEDELDKLAAVVSAKSDKPKVYLRLATLAAESLVASEAKFGQSATGPSDRAHVVELLLKARDRGLEPYGLAFHVGSQMEDPHAWDAPIRNVAAIMTELAAKGVRLGMLDIGGGFPAYHDDNTPDIAVFGKVITKALRQLPYQPAKIALEPGRALVSDAGAMVAEVYGTAIREGRQWVYLSVGAFNGMMEALETGMALHYPMVDSRGSRQEAPYIVSGPSCDSQDTIAQSQSLSADLREGDRVIIYTTGAYTTAYASHFNGFKPPRIVYV
jgi:ornithine decarboxylase